MPRIVGFGLAMVSAYLLSEALYLAVALTYLAGVPPEVFGYVLEPLTGILAVALTLRLRPHTPFSLVLVGVVIGRSLRGYWEFNVLVNTGHLSTGRAMQIEEWRIATVLIGALVATVYLRWKRRRGGHDAGIAA
jgi:hypothetical protein